MSSRSFHSTVLSRKLWFDIWLLSRWKTSPWLYVQQSQSLGISPFFSFQKAVIFCVISHCHHLKSLLHLPPVVRSAGTSWHISLTATIGSTLQSSLKINKDILNFIVWVPFQVSCLKRVEGYTKLKWFVQLPEVFWCLTGVVLESDSVWKLWKPSFMWNLTKKHNI